MNRADVESYLASGCGRCARYETPECSVHTWAEALRALRALVLATGLEEHLKWGSPCYTSGGQNVVMLGAFRDCCALSFFRGAELEDDRGLLVSPGPHSGQARVLRLRSAQEVWAQQEAIERLIAQAVALAGAPRGVTPKQAPEPWPEALVARLSEQPELARRFEALTPGRQRSHILYILGAKGLQAQQRRAQRCAAKIAQGLGWHDRPPG